MLGAGVGWDGLWKRTITIKSGALANTQLCRGQIMASAEQPCRKPRCWCEYVCFFFPGLLIAGRSYSSMGGNRENPLSWLIPKMRELLPPCAPESGPSPGPRCRFSIQM